MDRAWTPILEDPGHDHIALIYRDPVFLSRAVAHWSAPALRNGGGAIHVGTAAHSMGVREDLRRMGADVEGIERAGRLVFVDADWLMGHFILDGTPDAAKFRDLAREIVDGVRRSIAPGAPMRAWGEMVSLLRLRGDPESARRLEKMWQEVIAEEAIALLCTYDLRGRPGLDAGEFHSDIAHAHGRLILQPEGAEKATAPTYG